MPRASGVYEVERLDRIDVQERGHFWFVPRRRLLRDLVSGAASPDSRILDVGCGTGGLCEELRTRGCEAFGVDPHVEALGLDPRWYRRGTAECLPFPDRSFDAVCAFDVLEHVDDDVAAQELHRVLRPGGRLFATVPAYSWLWSERDEAAGHRRRYTRTGLRALLDGSGFEVESVFGYQFFLLPLLLASRLGCPRGSLRREDEAAPPLNALLRAINDAEVSLGSLWRPPLGSSLVATARGRA